MPSDTRKISSILDTPSAFSILAMMRILWQSCFSSSARRSRISWAVRVKEAAIKSNPCSTPKAISSRSLSLIKGRERWAPGTLIPLWEETTPPLTTVHTMSVSVQDSTRSSIKPSSIRILDPCETSCGRRGNVMLTMFSSPTTSRVVRVNVCPSSNVTLDLEKFPVRISGPLVSRRSAMGSFSSSRSFLTMSIRTFCSALV